MNRSSSLSGVKLRSAAAALAAMLALALAAAGCGEKEEPPTTGPVVAQTTTGKGTTQNGGNQGQPATDEEQVKTTVATYLTKAKAPDVCTKLVTPQFVKRSYGNVKGCEAARKPSAMAKAVTITPINGATGTMVTAKPKGGVFGGETLEVTLINLDGQWTIDRISSNAKVGP
jgi:hypothetical protein